MQTIVPLTKDGRIFCTDATIPDYSSPLHPPVVIGCEYCGEKITLEVPRLVPVNSLGGLKIVYEKKCVIRFYCMEKNSDITSQGNGSPENPFNHTKDAFDFIMCLKGRICADYLQIYLYPDSDEIHLDEFLSYGQYQLKSGIPVIIGDFDSTTKIKARVSSSVVRTNEATSFLVGMDIKASTESFGTFILYNCDMAVTRVSGISATAVDDIVNCRATGDIYGGRYIFGSTIYSNKIFNFKEIANSHIELAGDRHSTGIHLADVISSSTIIDKMGEYHDTYPTYCSADTILDSNFFITGRFLKIKTAIINSTIEYNEPLSQYDRQTVVVAEKDIIISKSSIKASCHFIVSSINYSCFGLIGVSISDGGSYSINNLSCSLTVTQNISNYYGHKYTCSAAVKGKGCITDCQIIASGNVNSVSFACSDIWYRF